MRGAALPPFPASMVQSETTAFGGMRKNSVASSALFHIRMKSCRRQRDSSGRRRLATSFFAADDERGLQTA
jgi:hypothetical protein